MEKTHHNSKITGAVCPAVDLPVIKASSEKCCTVTILTPITLKKLFCTVNYMYNKTLFLNLDLFHGFAERKLKSMPIFVCL